jgi:uroporphyrinogen decarboxylase
MQWGSGSASKKASVYLNAQIAAGVDAVMLFDTWGGALSAAAYERYSLTYMRQVLEQLTPGTPTIVFTKGGGVWLEQIAASGCSAVGVDWTLDLGAARARVGDRVALQGNLDPAILLTTPEVVATETRAVLDAYGAGPGHVFNLGHGVTPAVPPEHVAVLVDTVHEHSRRYHQSQG